MRWPFIEAPQTIEYDTLHALEAKDEANGWNLCAQAYQVKSYLTKKGRQHSVTQIRGGLQRLRKAGLVTYEGCMWQLKEPTHAQ